MTKTNSGFYIVEFVNAACLRAHREERPVWLAEPTADYSDIGLLRVVDSSTDIASRGTPFTIYLPTPKKTRFSVTGSRIPIIRYSTHCKHHASKDHEV